MEKKYFFFVFNLILFLNFYTQLSTNNCITIFIIISSAIVIVVLVVCVVSVDGDSKRKICAVEIIITKYSYVKIRLQ